MRPENNDRNAAECLCPGCPTYNGCMGEKSEVLFCSRDKTACSPAANGCICGECPVWSQYGLASYYFCREGAAV